MDNIEKVAKLLMYSGPSAIELIEKAVESNNEFTIATSDKLTILTIHSVMAYALKVTDVFTYNEQGHLIKQMLIMNGKEKIIFDKFKEASDILGNISKKKQLVS